MIFNYYQIKNLINNKIYIGITELTIEERYKQHKKMLNNNKHSNYHLQPDWNKYGEENFKLFLMESKEYDNLEDGYYHEYELIENSKEELYNIQPGGIVNPIKNKESYEKMVHTKRSQVPDVYALKEVSENVFQIIGQYPSQKEAARQVAGTNQGGIGRAIVGHYRHKELFWVTETNIQNNLKDWKPNRTRLTPTARLDDKENIIEVHHNARTFEQIYNYRVGSVSASICHNSKCHGYKYKYISEEEYYQYYPIILVK